MAKDKKVISTAAPAKKSATLVYSASPKEVDESKPGFSNVAPDSAQAVPYKREAPLPSQIKS